MHHRLNSQDAKISELSDDINRRPSIGEVTEMLEPKANRDVLTQILDRKANRGELDLAMAKKADVEMVEEVIRTLQNKADICDIETMSKQVADLGSTNDQST